MRDAIDSRASPVAGTILTNASSVPMLPFQALHSRTDRLPADARTAPRCGTQFASRTNGSVWDVILHLFRLVRERAYPRGERSHRHRSEVIVKMNRTHGHPWFAPAAARAALLALVCIAAGAVAFAVEQTGELKGTVRDNKGKTLPGVTAALSGVNLQGTRGAVSDANGEFVFRVLPPGPYTLRLTLEGYQTAEFDNVGINV